MSRVAVLHLEGSPADAELVRARLERGGVEADVTRVTDRESFAAALAAGGFDLILADDTPPDFDGLAALELAHAARPDVPFIFVCGDPGEDVAADALKRGATDSVAKPRLDRLAPAVGRAL
ncbi:MAG: response regulator, partial [Gemmataceae bacterium]|nr:response regulator [Gemmataceae bacterium]